jgi:alkylation response protein AidB-like acyl-CoA dehydrogenase
MDFELTDEQLRFKREVKRFAEEQIAPFAEAADAGCELSWPAWRKLGELGLLGLPFPEEYGGQGGDALTACLAGEALGEAGVDGGLTLSMGGHTYLCGETILRHGSPDLKQRYLPKIASGEWVGCMALTEPEAGSDAASITTTAVRQGDSYLLNGTKMFVTNGPIADVAVVFARAPSSSGHAGISAFVVNKGTPGFHAGNRLSKLGARSSPTSELILEDAQVPRGNLIGAEGSGFMIALGALEWDRSVLLAPFVGAMARALDDCAAYSTHRKQFGQTISSFPAIQHKLAGIKVFVEAARLLIYRVAWRKDQGKPMSHLEASVAKLFVADWGLAAASEAVQIFGGYGCMHEQPVERLFRDAKLNQIIGGTSEIQRVVIARVLEGTRR